MLDRVQCVSLPRSGHNLLVSHLQKYFRPASMCKKNRYRLLQFGTRSNSEKTPTDLGFHYCEYYYACRSHPCIEARNTFQKSHDFDLLLPLQADQKYLIQKRKPLDLLISWFEMRLLKGREKDTPEGFSQFVNRMRPYVDGFRQKWIDAPMQHRLVFDYNSYLETPAQHLRAAVLYFDDTLDIDMNRIEEIVSDVKPAKDNRKFRYIDTAPTRNCA